MGITTDKGDNVFHLLFKSYSHNPKEAKRLFSLLCSYETSSNYLNTYNNNLHTPLHIAVKKKLFKPVLELLEFTDLKSLSFDILKPCGVLTLPFFHLIA